jgi:hypothetical protein
MNNNKKLTIFVIGFLSFSIFLVSAYFGYDMLASKYNKKNIINENNRIGNQDSQKESIKVKVKAKDFVVYDENLKEVKLSDFLGTPVVLNFCFCLVKLNATFVKCRNTAKIKCFCDKPTDRKRNYGSEISK